MGEYIIRVSERLINVEVEGFPLAFLDSRMCIKAYCMAHRLLVWTLIILVTMNIAKSVFNKRSEASKMINETQQTKTSQTGLFISV